MNLLLVPAALLVLLVGRLEVSGFVSWSSRGRASEWFVPVTRGVCTV